MRLLYITNGINGAGGLERVLAVVLLIIIFFSFGLISNKFLEIPIGRLLKKII